MSKEKVSIKANFMYQMAYQILLIILPFVTSPYIARVIGAAGLGDYSFSYSIAYYFVLFANLGIQNYGNRTIAQCKEDENKLSYTFSNLVATHFLASGVSITIYFIYICTFASNIILALIQSFIIFGAFFDISWFYFGIEKFKLISIRSTIIKILTVLLVFAFVKTSNDLWKYCLIMALGTFLGNALLWFPLHNYVTLKKPSWHDMYSHFKPMFILFIPAIAVSLYKYMDKIMIGWLSTNTQLGFYENADKAINIPITIISSFGTVMLPRMSHLIIKKDWTQMSANIKKSMQFVMWMAIAFTFGIIGIAVDFATIFWGYEFTSSGYLMMGLATTIPFISFANVIRTQLLIPFKRDKEYIISVFIGAIINLLINSALIPIYGAYGATIGTIVAEVSVCIIQCEFVQKEINTFNYLKDCFYFSIFGIAMLFIICSVRQFLSNTIFNLFAIVLLGASIYCALSLLYFKINKVNWIFDSLHSFIIKFKTKL